MRLTKIYTRTGDDGQTRLANGQKVPKNSLRVNAYGDVDELNSILGVVRSAIPSEAVDSRLLKIQHHLFDLGGELASAGAITGLILEEHVTELEADIDYLNQALTPLEEFILPGGTKTASHLHHARTVCRRAERSMIGLAEKEAISETLIPFINRLSDLLFVMARFENQQEGNEEVYWKNPRKS
jgi:cob(I)alamin adenosyltransferase